MRFLLTFLLFLVPSVSLADPPSRGVISGVPFIGWHEAAQRDYKNKEIVNPSMIASLSMLLEYWGEPSEKAFEPGSGDMPPKNWTVEWSDEKDLQEVKSLVAQGIPIIVDMPLTMEGHPQYVPHAIMAMMKGLDIPDLGACSALHGAFLSFETIEGLRAVLGKEGGDFHPLTEVMLKATRVIVGYDDDRQRMIMHDPTFGPAWEVRYEDFEKMWAISPTGYGKIHPPDYQAFTKSFGATSPYRQRTDNEKAAWHLLHGCCLSACGRYQEAEQVIASALTFADLSIGYRHMILLELARHQAERGDYEGALGNAVSASDLLPEDFLVWELLGILYLNTGDKTQAKEAQRKALKLKKSSSAAEHMAEVIPSDYFIRFLGQTRGWAPGGGK